MTYLLTDTMIRIGTPTLIPIQYPAEFLKHFTKQDEKYFGPFTIESNFPEPGGCYIRVGTTLVDLALAWRHGKMALFELPHQIEYNGYHPKNYLGESEFNVCVIFRRQLPNLDWLYPKKGSD